MTKILITGTYVSDNRGDAAMQWTMVRELRRALPDADLVIHTPFPERDASYYEGVRVVASSRRKLVRASLALAWLAARRAAGMSGTRFPSQELRELASSDLIIDLSGDMLTEAHGPHLTYSHFLPLMMAQLLGRPVFVCAQSIGPFRFTRPVVRTVLARAAAITAREDVTRRYLQETLALSVERTADVAFLLDPAPPSRVDEMLGLEGIPDGGGFLGVSVSGIVAARHRRARGARGAVPFPQEMARALDLTHERFGMPIVFVSHVLGPRPAKDDRRLARQIHGLMQRREHARVVEGAYRAEELKALIARCGAFVGARMHANIAALSSEVPVLAISYSHKTQGIMASLGVGDWVLDARDLTAERLVERVSALWTTRATIAAAVRSRLDDVRASARRNVDVALALVGRGGSGFSGRRQGAAHG